MTEILDGRDAHQGTPDHQGEGEVGDPTPAPAPARAAAPAATPAPVAETPATPATKPEAEQPFWYRKEIAKERDRAKALERENAELRSQAPQQRQEPEDPDRPLTRAELEFYRNQDALIGRLERSEERFVDKLGEETFDATKEWLTTRPDIEEWALKQRDPWKAAHSQFTKERLAAEIGEDPNAWREAEREKLRQEILAEQNEGQHTPAPRAAPQMRAKPPAPASTAPSSGAPRDGGGRFTGPTPMSAILKR